MNQQSPVATSAPSYTAAISKIRHPRVLLVGGVVVVLMLMGLLMWRRRANGDIQYRFAPVEQGSIRQTVSATGALGAVKTVQVGTQVSGQVSAIYADFNDRVTKGQLLARIDPTLQEQAVRDADAQLGKARAQLAEAQAEYNRNAPLAQEKFISASEFGTVRVNLAVAQAGVRSAQVTLDKARQNLAYTSIFAPINGVVVERNVDVGQTVAASLSAPQLFLIAQDLSRMQILASVDESDISAIRDSQPVDFTVQAFTNRTFHGTVDEVRLQSKTTDNVVNYTVVVAVDNADGRLLPGMTATVEFITGHAENVLTVPNAALRYRPSAEEMKAAGISASDTARRRRNGTGQGGATSGAGGGGASRGGGGGAGTAGRGGAAGANRARRTGGGFGTLYTLDAKRKLKAYRVRTGLTDGQRTQVTGDSVVAGMQVIIGSTAPPSATPAASGAGSNPLTPQRGGGPPGRGF